jgi:hypothetical protein
LRAAPQADRDGDLTTRRCIAKFPAEHHSDTLRPRGQARHPEPGRQSGEPGGDGRFLPVARSGRDQLVPAVAAHPRHTAAQHSCSTTPLDSNGGTSATFTTGESIFCASLGRLARWTVAESSRGVPRRPRQEKLSPVRRDKDTVRGRLLLLPL